MTMSPMPSSRMTSTPPLARRTGHNLAARSNGRKSHQRRGRRCKENETGKSPKCGYVTALRCAERVRVKQLRYRSIKDNRKPSPVWRCFFDDFPRMRHLAAAGCLPADLRHETIAARLGHQDLGTCRVALDLLTKAIDVGLQCVGGHPGIVAPHFIKKGIASDHPITGSIEIF